MGLVVAVVVLAHLLAILRHPPLLILTPALRMLHPPPLRPLSPPRTHLRLSVPASRGPTHRVPIELPGPVEILRTPETIQLADPVTVRRHILASLLRRVIDRRMLRQRLPCCSGFPR